MNNKKILARAGMTLIEVIAAMAVIAVCAAMLTVGYGAALNIIRRSTSSAHAADSAFAASQQPDAQTARGSISFWASGQQYTVDGEYSIGESGGFTFYSFAPSSAGGAP